MSIYRGTQCISGYTDISGKANTDLSNLSTTGEKHFVNKNQITNCILEDPQNIKLTLSDGTLTLKAGSKVVVPNGFESDGTTPKFDEVTVESNITRVSGTANIQLIVIFDIEAGNAIRLRPLSQAISGSNAPTTTGSWTWYDTTNNNVKVYNDTTLGTSNNALPLGIVTCDTNGSITSIDQTFQSIGYIGSTVFVRKGLKVLIPNGRNDDGSLKNIEYTTTSVVTRTYTSGTGDYYQFVNDTGIGSSSSSIYRYDAISNYNLHNTTIMGCCIGLLSCTSGVISNFKPYVATNILKYSDSSQINTWGFPSATFTTLTLGASGTAYTAPANGWVSFEKIAGIVGGYLYIASNNLVARGIGAQTGDYVNVFLPVQKNATFIVAYSATGTTQHFKFIYAQGEV